MLKARHLVLLSLLLISSATHAQQKSFKNEFGFQSDNDAYLAMGHDRYYTNGLFITFRHAMDQSKLTGKVAKKIWEAEAGQMIFNPFTGQVTDIRNIDRPFSGYLYAGASMNWLFRNEHSLRAGLQIGTIGPASLAQEAQELLHRVIGFYEIKGWEYQLNNELGVNASLSYNRLLGRSAVGTTDLVGTSYLNLGNTFAGAGVGVLFRAGKLGKLFNSASTSSRVSNHSGEAGEDKKEFFFFLKPELNYVAYDATIQGGLFAKDKGPVTFDVKPLVISQELGVDYATHRWTLDFFITLQSREIKSTARAQQFGTARIYYRFN